MLSLNVANTVELNLLEELVSSTHTLSLKTICANLVSLNENVLYSIGTSLRKFLVKFLRTLWRCITLNFNLSIG